MNKFNGLSNIKIIIERFHKNINTYRKLWGFISTDLYIYDSATLHEYTFEYCE